MTSDLGNGRTVSQQAAVPTPSCIRARRAAVPAAGLARPALMPAPSAGAATPVPPAAAVPAVVPAPRMSGDAEAPAAEGLAALPDASGSGPQIALAGSGSGRMTARSAIYAALCGARLGSRDRQFLARLVSWDKRSAASVAALLWRAREAGREEAALTPRQLEVVLSALNDAAVYRASGRAAAFCWDCELVPGGKCGEHAKDNDRALAYTEAARVLSGRASLPSAAVLPGKATAAGDVQNVLPPPRGIAGYRRRASVAS